MGDGAAEGTPIPGLEVTDVGEGEGQQRHVAGDPVGCEGVGLAQRRPSLDRIGADFDRPERVETRNVDHRPGTDEPHVQHRSQRHAAGENAGLETELVQQRDGLLGRVGAAVFEGSRFHASSPARKRRRQKEAVSPASSRSSRAKARKNWRISASVTVPSMRWPTVATLPPTRAPYR